MSLVFVCSAKWFYQREMLRKMVDIIVCITSAWNMMIFVITSLGSDTADDKWIFSIHREMFGAFGQREREPGTRPSVTNAAMNKTLLPLFQFIISFRPAHFIRYIQNIKLYTQNSTTQPPLHIGQMFVQSVGHATTHPIFIISIWLWPLSLFGCSSCVMDGKMRESICALCVCVCRWVGYCSKLM